MASTRKHRVKTNEVASKPDTRNKKPGHSAAKSKIPKAALKVKPIVVPSHEDSSDDDSMSDSDTPHVAQGKDKHDSQSISSSDEDSSSDSSEDQKSITRPKPTKKAKSSKGQQAPISDDSSDSSENEESPSKASLSPVKNVQSSSDDSDDSSDSVDKSPSKAPSSPLKNVQSSNHDSDDSSDSSEEDESPSRALSNRIKKSHSSNDDSGDSSDSSDESPSKAPSSRIKNVQSSSDDSDDDGVSSTEEESSQKMGEKRKPPEAAPQPPKRMKLLNGEATPTNTPTHTDEVKSIFVGRLSWNVDDDWLAQEFSECGKVVSATVQLDRNTGKSRGFGYVHFATAEAVTAALAMNGKEIDGRPVNIDKSRSPDPTRSRINRAKTFGDETGPPSNTLFVASLSFFVKEDALWELFGEYGPVKSVRLLTDRETGKSKGIAYVEFEAVESAKKAFEGAQHSEVEGRVIRLDFAQPRDSGGTSARGGYSDRGARGNSRGGFRGGFRGFGDRGTGTRGRGGTWGGRGGHRGRIAPSGKKTTFT